jgi:hypothetical protein
MISRFRGAFGTAGVVYLALAALAWLVFPFGHPVFAVFVPPLIVAGLVFARIRLRTPRAPSVRDNSPAPVSDAPIEPK